MLPALPAAEAPEASLPADEAAEEDTLAAVKPDRLEDRAAALDRLVGAAVRHYPYGVDLAEFCNATGLSDRHPGGDFFCNPMMPVILLL